MERKKERKKGRRKERKERKKEGKKKYYLPLCTFLRCFPEDRPLSCQNM